MTIIRVKDADHFRGAVAMDSTNGLDRIGKILIYQTEKGNTKIDVCFQDETIWMSQKSLA